MSKVKGYKSYDRALAQSVIINANPEVQGFFHEDHGCRYFGVGELVVDGDVWKRLYVGQRGVLTSWPELKALGWVWV